MAKKVVVEGKVIGQHVLNITTKQIDVKAPEIAQSAVPGQFVNVQVSKRNSPLLRRPFGIASVNKETGIITMIYRILGDGTKILRDVCSGDEISIVGPLGKGFDLKAKKPLIVGGGLGLAPLLSLAEGMEGKKADVLMGGRCEDDMFWTDYFAPISNNVYVTTDDGSMGIKGTVMAVLPKLLAANKYDCVYVCGPEPMMKAVAAECMKQKIKCQVSLEKYMACGLGACLSCSCEGIGERIKVCTDGPVFWAEEVGEW